MPVTDVKIYVDQTAVKLTLITDIDFGLYTINTYKIHYEKPSGAAGSWTAAPTPGGGSDGRIFVDFDDTIKFDEEGKWKLWAKLTFADSRVANGETYPYYVKTEGSI